MKGRRPEEYEGLVRTVLLMLMLVSAYFIVRGGARFVSSPQVEMKRERPCVIIDAGHGGVDPGKVSVDGALEKDINLAIAQKLQRFLQQQDVDAVLTRQSDAGLYDENASNKKVQDMKNRVALIEERQPVLTVSIHQNSYHEENVSGGQVFYYKDSEKGKELAEILQKRFDFVLGEKNKRLAKPNGNYYLLLHVKQPIVIVECGFLSNWKEAKALNTEDYQDRMAWTIHMGIMEYLNHQ